MVNYLENLSYMMLAYFIIKWAVEAGMLKALKLKEESYDQENN